MDDADQRIGQVLADRYELTGVIGRGGMGAVYRAWDTRLQRFVAIKLFAPGTASEDERRRAEVNLLARLNHPNLVTLHDAHLAPADSATPSFLVMELVDGPDLRIELERGPLAGDATAQVAFEIAEALVAVHSLGVVHRDLKPANILLAPTGLPSPAYHAKLGDFGIAHLLGAERVTTVGTVIGTASYLSPEQTTGDKPSAASDVYSLGLVVLECLTGERAYPGNAVEAVSARLARDPAIPEGLPIAWASLLSQMTARDPAMRPNSLEVAVTTREIADELRGWVPASQAAAVTAPTVAMLPPTLLMPVAEDAGAAIVAPASDRPGRGRLVAILAGAAALIVALILGASMLLNAPQAAVPPTNTPSPSSPAPATTPSLAPTTAPPTTGNGNGKGHGDEKGNGNGNGGD